jgi:hypothetical protein
MGTLELTPVVSPSFALKPSLANGAVSVALTGTGDLLAMPQLGSFLKQLHVEVTRLSVKLVVMDIRELYFLNSSCLKQFVTWLKSIRGAGTHGYQVQFISNANLRWQRRTLAALQALSDGAVTIRE